MEIAVAQGITTLFKPRSEARVVDRQTLDDFQTSRAGMAGKWGLAMGGSYLAGALVNAGWSALNLAPNANLGPVGMVIGGGIGAAATFFMLREKLGDLKAAGAAVVVGGLSAVAWNHFGLAGLREGLGMALGGGIGVAVGLKSTPREHRNFLDTMSAALLGVGFCHSAGIVGAATGFAVPALTVGLTGLYTGIGGLSGNMVARANERALRRHLIKN